MIVVHFGEGIDAPAPRAGDEFTDAAGCTWTVRACSADSVAVARPGDPEAVVMALWEWEATKAALAAGEE